MSHRNGFAKHAAGTSAIANAVTTAAVTVLAKNQTKSAVSAVNAGSHIVWGEEAVEHDEASLKYTGLGALIGGLGVSFWAVVHEYVLRKTKLRDKTLGPLATGAAVSALAYVTDYHVVPKRLTPGYEKRLSPKGIFIVYAVLAVGLAAGAMLAEARDKCEDYPEGH